ncbi:hypothetical protein KZY63_08740 [Prevotella histicola]|uniref:hypothetical protein n=1 Tax=Prevotella histicola TaxID=470565 RepID=UPI001C5FDD41|nr:hypothetical protein [Prevotella histicola]MBW4712193.1 hypothetical protein [Prevotella histicola]MBW4876852.1 hypothetical protein [Prevotella histicola]MBW4921311.1 hypothetical protein [Prevotella histicola]
MNILVDIFKNFSTFSLYAPGVETNMDLNDLRSSGLTARKRIETVISRAVFDELLKEKEDSPLMEALRAAMANMTMANQIIFDSVNRRKSEVNVYKYELEAMKRSYMENYCNAIDTLVQLLSEPTEGEIAELWRKTPYFPILERCEIKTMDQMDSIYPIDASYLYFFRTIPLQKETLDEVMSIYFEKLTDDNRERIRPILLLALVKKTIAKSLRRFDILEFPSTIRNLFDDSHAARSGKDESSAIFALADRLDREAEELLSNADTLLSSESVSDFCSNSAYNHPDDNIIMLP